MIEFNHVNFKYPNFKMQGINFTINEGEIVAIVGGNASGKSTLLNLMSGIIKPSSGKVLVDGEKPVCGKKIGMVFQNPDNQIIFSTVEEDISFTLKNQKVPKPEWSSRISEALNLVALSGFEKHETATLSAGQKQRLVLANMLATKPKILLLDEVSVYLDPTAKTDLFKLFDNLKKAGISLIFATNVLDEIVFADRVMVIDNGEIKAFEPTQNIIDNLRVFDNLNLAVPLKLKLINYLELSGVKFDDEVFSEITWRLK